MEKLFIKCFKAFSEEVELKIACKSLLLYGENGAGKSSIYEAIKYIFFKDKIENRKIYAAMTPEDKEQQRNDIKDSFNNKKQNIPFELKVNGIDYESFNKDDYQVFMVSSENIFIDSNIVLTDLLKNCYFTSIDDISSFLNTNFPFIEEYVNDTLKNSFKENIHISIDSGDNFKCIITDDCRNISRKEELKIYFNEAKLNLILLLLHFTIIEIVENSSKKKLLILDDFITSMDAANRTFIIKLILDTFSKFQKIILTHNISFFNLITYTNNIYNKKEKWNYINLYESNNSHLLYEYSLTENVDKIREDFIKPDTDIMNIGNRIRKKFEILLYEFSKLSMIGAVEDSHKILELLLNDKPIYYFEKKTSCDLINEIETTLNSHNQSNLQKRIKDKIESYKRQDLDNLRAILKDLTLYQKVTMHPLSHGIIGMTPFTQKEIDESLYLLERLESNLKGFVNGNVTNI